MECRDLAEDFTLVWMGALRTTLNDGLLPSDYYALCEQDATDVGPDVLTLRAAEPGGNDGGGVIAVAISPPKVQLTASAEVDFYALKQRRLVIRHSSNDRIIALLEILSPANRRGQKPFRNFLDKALAALAHGYHLLLVDLHPPTRRDPDGIHGALWSEISDEPYVSPPDKPLTLASYAAGPAIKAYVNRLGVGDSLPDMPLFLTPDDYVSVPCWSPPARTPGEVFERRSGAAFWKALEAGRCGWRAAAPAMRRRRVPADKLSIRESGDRKEDAASN